AIFRLPLSAAQGPSACVADGDPSNSRCDRAEPNQFLSEVWVNERVSGCCVRQPLVVHGCIETGAKAPQTTPRRLELLTASPLGLFGSRPGATSWVIPGLVGLPL